jgi:hypothetical protein
MVMRSPAAVAAAEAIERTVPEGLEPDVDSEPVEEVLIEAKPEPE